MTIFYRSSLEGYEATSMVYSAASDLMCPNCGKRDFRVWFAKAAVVDLTCTSCGNFIHILSIDKE